MKIFIEPEGKFAIKVPIEWEYRNTILEATHPTPHSFELYKNPVGCFQISCVPKTKGEVPKLISANNLKPQKIGEVNLDFTERVFISDSFDMYLWMALVEEDFFLVKYIYESKKRKLKSLPQELQKARDVLPSILLISSQERERFLTKDRFDKFMSSIAATIDLTNRAFKNESYIELVVLLANRIDALLRLSLILSGQIKNKNDFIDTTFIFQSPTDKPIMEKKIYERALSEGIIDQKFHDSLFNLYDERNKVVHRYIITDLKTRDVIKIVMEYSILLDNVDAIIETLEETQFQSKIGIYGGDIPPKKPLDQIGIKRIISNIKDKHGDKRFNENISIK